jgi:lipopolysaccharide transport system permease protein
MKGMVTGINLWVLALPLIILQMALLGIGCGILISSMTTKYRDLCQVVGFGVQLWMYATPVVYPLSQIPQQYRIFYTLNPMASVIESFRAIFLGTSSVTVGNIMTGWGITLVFLFVGLVLFNRVEKTFIDTV